MIKNYFISSFVVLFLQVSTFAQAQQNPFKEISEHVFAAQLKNGVRVILLPDGTSQMFARVRVARGFADEAVAVEPALSEVGATHSLEHLLFRGTRSFPDMESLIREKEIQTNANTDWHETNYYQVGSSEHADFIIRSLGSMMHEALLQDAAIESEIKPVAEELDMRPKASPFVDLAGVAMSVHARDRGSHLMGGLPSEVIATSPQTIRNLYRRLYSAENITLVVAGGTYDMDEVQSKIIESFGKIPRRKVSPPPNNIAPFFFGGAQSDSRMVYAKVKSEVPTARHLTVQIPIRNSGRAFETTLLLERLFGQQGEGSPLRALVDRRIVTDFAVETELLRDVVLLQFYFALTPQGEQHVQDITNTISSAIGSIRAHGVADEALDELKRAFVASHSNEMDFMGLAEEIALGVERYGLETPAKFIDEITQVSADELKSLSQEIGPEHFRVTLLTANLQNGTRNELLGREVEMVDTAAMHQSAVATLNDAVSREALNVHENPFLRLDHPQRIRVQDGALEVVVIPDFETAEAEAHIEYQFNDTLSRRDRYALALAFDTFKQDPKNFQLFHDANDAGVGFAVQFNRADMSLTIRAGGKNSVIAEVLPLILAQFRTYELNQEVFERVKLEMIDELQQATNSDVSKQALRLGMSRLGGNDTRDLSPEIEMFRGIDFADAVNLFNSTRSAWRARAAITGNWVGPMVREAMSLVLHENSQVDRPNRQVVADKYEGPQLWGRVTPIERQALARFYPMQFAPHSREHLALSIFASALDTHMTDVVRTEHGLIYAGGAGLASVRPGMFALYLVGDTTHRVSRLAGTYTLALHDVLDGTGVFTQEIFDRVKEEVMHELVGGGNGADATFARHFYGVNEMKALQILQNLTREEVLSIAHEQIENSHKLDTIVVPAHDACANILLNAAAVR